MAETKLKIVPKENPEKANSIAQNAGLFHKLKERFSVFLIPGLAITNILFLAVLMYYQNMLWVRVKELSAYAQSHNSALMAKKQLEEHKEAYDKQDNQSAGMLGTLFQMESFLINITSDQGPKYLQAQMELELSDPSLEDEVTRKKPVIRDAIIVLLSSRSYSELREANKMKQLRVDLLKAINTQLTTGKVVKIYFTQFHFN